MQHQRADVLKVVSNRLWNVIGAKSRVASMRRAAIAYVGESPPIIFGKGDLLVVDASDSSIKSGRTSARALAAFHKAGAELFSYPHLHAKVMLLDDWAVVGSANASRPSEIVYLEAAVITDRPDITGQVERLISELAERSALINEPFLERILRLPVVKAPFVPPRRGRRQLAPTLSSPCAWLVSLWEEASYPGDEAQIEAITKEEQKKVGRKAGEVAWFFWSGRTGFPAKAKVGDIVVECWRPRAKINTTRSVRVFRHARLLRIFKEPGVKATTFHCLWPPDSARTAMSWTAFTWLATSAGIKRKLTYRSTVQLSEQESAALFELWPK